MHQQANTLRKRSRNGDLRRMEKGHDIPSELLGGPRRKGRIEIVGDREQRADDVVRLQPVRIDHGAQQLVCCGENLFSLVPVHSGRSPDSMEANGWRHET